MFISCLVDMGRSELHLIATHVSFIKYLEALLVFVPACSNPLMVPTPAVGMSGLEDRLVCVQEGVPGFPSLSILSLTSQS